MALENIPESSELRTEGLAEQIQSEFQAGSELAAQDVERERLSSMELDYSTAENPFGDLAGFNIDFFQNDPKNTQNSVTNQGGGPGDPVPKPRPTRTLAELRKDYQELMQSSKEWGKTFGFEKVKRDPMLAAGDYTFDQYTTNVDRYRGYGKSTFNKLGFNPLDDNETYYNVNTTGWQDFKRMTSQWGKLFGTAFMSNYNSIAHSLTSESLLDPDIEAANKYERAMRLGLSTKNSALGKFTNFSLNSAYTLGIVANVAAEEFIIAGLTAAAAPLTGGGSLVVGAAATATTVKRAARAIDKINDIRRIAAMNIRNTSLLGGGSTMIGGGMQFVRNLKNINNAREFWTGARTAGLTFAKGLGKFVNPLTGTTTFIRGVTEGTNAYKGLTNYAKLTKGFGAFYRDVRENLYSLGESQLEGGTVYNNVFDEALEYYKQKHDGQMPDERGWASIYETAETAGKLDTIINLPVIFLTNRLVFDGLFRFKGLSNAMDAAEEAAMRNTAKGFKWDLTAKTFSDQVNNFAKRTKNSLFVSPKVYLGNFLNYTKANWAEGFQEYFQEAAGSAITNYYVKTYKNPAIGGSEFAKASAWSAIKEYAPWTPKGFEVFANGFFMGGVTKRVSNLTLSVLNGSAELYTKTFDKERYKTYVENKAKAKEEALDALNAIIADPERYFSRRKESAVNQYRANQNMSQAELNDDDKTFYDSKDEKILDHIFTVLDSKTYDLLISALRDMGKLSDVELSQAFNLAEGTKAKEKIEEYIERANEIKQIYNKVNSEFSNPFNPKKFSKIGKDGKMDANYINETLAYKAYEDAKKLAIASQFGFDRAVTRIQGILSDLSRSAAIMSASATDFNILQNKDLISNEIAILASEISQLSSSKDAKQKELAKKKKKKLDALVKYSNALEKFELDSKSQSNVNEKGQFTIPFNEETTAPLKEAYSEYLRAIANINNEKYIFDDKIENSFKKILDIYNLSRDAQNYLSNVNALANPEILARHATVINKTLRDMYDKRSNILADAFDEIFFINEINNLTKHLAELGVKVTDEQLEELIDNGKLPTQFFDLISNEILVDTDEKVLKAKEAIQTFINFREEKLATLEAEEEVAPVEEKPKEQPKEEKKVEVKPIGEDLQSKLNQAYDDFVKRYPDATLTFDEFVDQHPAALRIQAEYEAEVERKAEPKPAEEKKEAKPEVLSTAPTAAPVSDATKRADIEKEVLGSFVNTTERTVKSKGPNNGRTIKTELTSKISSDGEVIVYKSKNTFTDNGESVTTSPTSMTIEEFKKHFYPMLTAEEIEMFEETLKVYKEEGWDGIIFFKELRVGSSKATNLKGQLDLDIQIGMGNDFGFTLTKRLSDSELAALEGAKPAEAPTEVVSEKPVEKKPKPITIQNGKITITPTPTDTFSQTYTFTVKDGKVVEGRHQTYFQGEYRDRTTDDPISNPAEEYNRLSAGYSEQQITQDSSDVIKETSGAEKAKSILDSVSSLKDLSNPKMTDKNTSTLKLLDLVIEGKISPEDVLVLVEKRRAELLEKLIISDLSKNDYLIFTDGRKGWITSTNPKKNTINVKIVGSAKGVVQTINIEDVKKNLVSVEKKKVVKVEPAEKVTISKVDKETIIESRDTMDEFKDDSAKTKQIADDIAKSDKTDNTDNLNNLLDSLGCDV